MAKKRLKGQDVEVLLIDGGEVVEALTDIKSFTMEPEQEILSEDFLGQKTSTKDEVYGGVTGTLELQISDPKVFDVLRSINNRAKNQVPGTQINIKATFNFPSGSRYRILIPDTKFGSMPVSFSGRKEYGSVSLSYAADDYEPIA